MFIAFDFGNFRSFRDMQRFSMQASPLRSNDNGLQEDNVFTISSLRLLKSKAVFGGNASGKSNLGKALGAFCLMVNTSVINEALAGRIWEDRFKLITDWDDQPVTFQYTFLYDNIVYRYGFQLLDAKISQEWLYGWRDNNETEYFIRNKGEVTVNPDLLPVNDAFIQQVIKGDNELFRDDSLLVTAGAVNGNKFLGAIRNEIRNVFSVDGGDDEAAIQFTLSRLAKGTEEQKAAIKQLLSAADTGVEDVELEDIPDEFIEKHQGSKKPKTLFSTHSRYDDDGNFKDKISVPFSEWESEGTAKLLGLSALILDALNEGRIILIDELDARFHPNLTLKIVQLFQDPRTNTKNGQLVFITHDASLLRRADLRRDQICLVDKDKYGVSTLTNLIEYKGVRKDASYDKEYLNGNYSGVPYLDRLSWILNKKQDLDEL